MCRCCRSRTTRCVLTRAVTATDAAQSYEFRFIRDYEIASTRPLKSEYVFTFEDAPEGGLLKRARGAYYAEVAAASLLRKRRPRVSPPCSVERY